MAAHARFPHRAGRPPFRLLGVGLLLLSLGLLLLPPAAATPPGESLAPDFPHWQGHDRARLWIIEQFIADHRGQGDLAVFDFDGTIISEEYSTPDGRRRSGQSAWHQWGARHLAELPGLFPLLRVGDSPAADGRRIEQFDNILEGFTPVDMKGWGKFTRLATFEAGMSPGEFDAALECYLDDEPPARAVFLPMLDLMENLARAGFKVWIISGSNPRYISAVLRRVQQTVEFKPGEAYTFGGLAASPYAPFSRAHPQGARLIGNMALVGTDGRLTALYDDRFTRNERGEPQIIERAGKVTALEGYAECQDRGQTVFCAGNSDGDFEIMRRVLAGGRDHLGLMVNPRGKEFPGLRGQQTVVISLEPMSAPPVAPTRSVR